MKHILVSKDSNPSVYSIPDIVEDIVDINGDSYSAGFVFKYLKTKSVEESIKFASIYGALACLSQDLYNLKASEDHVELLMKKFK